MNDTTQQLLEIQAQHKKRDEDELDTLCEESQDEFKRRVQLASEDPSLNLDISDEYKSEKTTI